MKQFRYCSVYYSHTPGEKNERAGRIERSGSNYYLEQNFFQGNKMV